MTNIFNTDNLYWVYTKYAINRLTNFDASKNLKLFKIKIGDYNWYTDENSLLGGNYSEESFKEFFQTNEVNELGHNITTTNEYGDTNEPLTFPIDNKELDLTENRVTLTTNIGEKFGGFDIREVGIYETTDEGDKLFAICTMQPLPRPSSETNHFISTQIKCHLFSPMLVNLFDYIEVDPENNYATKDDINKFQLNLLFVESNLSQQISRNAQIIGYNRVEQLHKLIKENKENYAKFGLSAIYANIANVQNLDIKGFWSFNYSGQLDRYSMLNDLSIHNNNLGADQLSSLYTKGYEGLASWLNFNDAHFYNTRQTKEVYYETDENDIRTYYAKEGTNDLTFIDLVLNNNRAITNVSDSPFSIIFVGSQNSNENDCTLFDKYNTFTEHPGIKTIITKNRELKITLYTNKNCYAHFKTAPNTIPKAGEFYALIISYNGDSDNPKMVANINGVDYSLIYSGTAIPYKGMSLEGALLPMFSFERTDQGDINYINSKVCLLSLIKGEINYLYRKSVAYSLISLLGINPCLL